VGRAEVALDHETELAVHVRVAEVLLLLVGEDVVGRLVSVDTELLERDVTEGGCDPG
jgi:hypothetical protein